MPIAYQLLEFVHVAAAVVWVGGAAAISLLSTRALRRDDLDALRRMGEDATFFGRSVLGPSALVTLVSGVSLVALAGWNLTLWTGWGLAGVAGSMFIGIRFIAPAHRHLVALVADEWADPRAIATARRVLMLPSVLNLVLLMSIVFAMVVKPTL